jgi:hypothetical protein
MNPYILLGVAVFLGLGIGFAHSGEFKKLLSLQFHMAGLFFLLGGIISIFPRPFMEVGEMIEFMQAGWIMLSVEFIVSIIFCLLNLAPHKEMSQ